MRSCVVGLGVIAVFVAVACGGSEEATSPSTSTPTPPVSCGTERCAPGEGCFSTGKYGRQYCAPPHGLGQPCDFSTSYVIIPCADGLHCGPGRTCHAPEPAGAACGADATCHSQHCYRGVCEPGDPQPAQCAAGSCPADRYCELHTNPAQCMPLLATGSDCTEDVQCQSGVCCTLVCIEDRC